MKTSQCDKILDHLSQYGFITAREAMNAYGCYRLAARVSDLRARGVNIVSERGSGKNKDGEPISFAVYRLGGQPHE